MEYSGRTNPWGNQLGEEIQHSAHNFVKNDAESCRRIGTLTGSNPDDKARVLIYPASAIPYLHRQAPIHRYLKPEKVLLRYEEEGRIGLAK